MRNLYESALRTAGAWLQSKMEQIAPWSTVYGLARTLLASATCITIAVNPTWLLFRPEAGSPAVVNCAALAGKISLFCVVPAQHLGLARFAACLILAVVASGWRPRVTALFHWWVAYSFYNSVKIGDGGEQAAAVLTLLILPLALTDPRTWHWQQQRPARPRTDAQALAWLIATAGVIIMQLQVSVIYLNAAVAKLNETQWLDGTVMYYVINNNYFGAPDYLHWLLQGLAASPFIVLLTWLPLLLELMLGVNVLLAARLRRPLFVAAVLFHVGIAILIGIPSFATIMIAGLMMGVLPIGTNLAQLVRAGAQETEPGAAKHAHGWLGESLSSHSTA